MEILNVDGSMARLPDLMKIGKEHGLKIISIEDLVAYRMQNETIVREVYRSEFDSIYGHIQVVAFEQSTSEDIHLALIKGQITSGTTTDVRVHSAIAGEQIYNILSDTTSPIKRSLEYLKKKDSGVVVIMRHEERNIDLLMRMKALSGEKVDNKTSSEIQKDFGVGAQILRKLGVEKMNLLSNNPKKRIALDGYGLEIVDYQSF